MNDLGTFMNDVRRFFVSKFGEEDSGQLSVALWKLDKKTPRFFAETRIAWLVYF